MAIDAREIKIAARGQWRRILSTVGIPGEILDGRGHGCPKCGGVDRFAFTNKENDGSANCRHCLKSGDGLAVIQWFTGCTFPEAIRIAAEALGIRSGMPAVKTPQTAANGSTRANAVSDVSTLLGSPTAVYEYPTSDRSPRLVVARYDEPGGRKTFRQCSNDGDGWRREGIKERAPLYRLPELEADNNSGPLAEPFVVVCEGEKCVDAITGDGWHLVSTTSHGGSNSPGKTDWSPLAGRRVVIVPDRDDAGDKYAAAVREILFDIGAESVGVVLLEGNGGTPAGFDVVDWIADGGTVNQFRALLESAEFSNPLETESGGTMSEVIRDLRPVIVDRLLREGETINIVAPSKTGKSWLSMDLAQAIAAGENWLGEFQTVRGEVLVVDAELHRETLAKRIRDIAEARGRTLDVLNRVHVKATRGKLKDINQLCREFLTHIRPGQFSVIVLDALYRFLPVGVSENDNAQMQQIYNLLDSVSTTLGCAFAVIHHSAKGSQTGKSIMDVGAGAGSIGRATDSHLIIRKHNTDGLFVLDRSARSFPPMEPVTIKFDYPTWNVVKEIEPVLEGAVGSEASRRERTADEARACFDDVKNNSSDPGGLFTAHNMKTLSGRSRSAVDRFIDWGLSAGVLIVAGTKNANGRDVTQYRFADQLVGGSNG
jgi:hypothetical protein